MSGKIDYHFVFATFLCIIIKVTLRFYENYFSWGRTAGNRRMSSF